MGEIKSTLDIVMEKTQHLSLSTEAVTAINNNAINSLGRYFMLFLSMRFFSLFFSIKS